MIFEKNGEAREGEAVVNESGLGSKGVP